MPSTIVVYGFKGATVCDNVLDSLLGSGTPGTLYARAYTTAPTKSGGGTEAAWVGYTSLAITNNSTNFPAASSQQKTNGADYTFPALGGGSSAATVVGIAIAKTSSGALGAGDIVYYAELLTPRSLIVGDVLVVPSGQLAFTEA